MDVGFHEGAKSALRVTAILCIVTILGLPFGVWLLYRISTARLRLDGTGVTARAAFKTTRVDFADVERFGVVRIAIVAGGIAGVLARRKVGGDSALHLCFRMRSGATKMFMVSLFDGQQQLTSEITRLLGKPLEPLKMGLWTTPKWPGA